MAHVAINADEYANPRQNIFFTGVIPELDGQCVSLVKWFMQDMSDVPNPQAARGDARYVGQTLVAQGHAVEVPYAQRQRGDIICYEYGTYGHIAVQLSGGRVFEQNVNIGGVASKVVAGSTVYASRIGSENESWRTGKNPHVYRLNTYKEGSNMTPSTCLADEQFIRFCANAELFRDFSSAEVAGWIGQSCLGVVVNIMNSQEWKDIQFRVADYPGLQKKYTDLQKEFDAYKKANPPGGGGNCTTEERAYLDSMYKIVSKKG